MTPVGRKAGAIPYVARHGAIEFLLITSRKSGRWIFPKGGLISGLAAPDSAAREAYEEAGVEGVVSPDAVGAYVEDGGDPQGSALIEMYPMRVERELDDWPEKDQRRRRWATLAEARNLVAAPDLLGLAERTSEQALS